MKGDGLFGELPEQHEPRLDAPRGAPRLREPVRNQIELRSVDLDSLIGLDHRARVIWAYVESLDLSELEDRVKARDNRPGHPAPSPRLLLSLWLTPPAMASAARGRWSACATAMMPIAGCVAVCR